MYSNEFKILFVLILLHIVYSYFKNKSLEKMTDDSTFSPVHLTAIRNLGNVAASMISADGGTLTLPYNVKVNGKLDINSSLTTNNESVRLTVWNGKAYLQTNQDTWTFADIYSANGTKNLENVKKLYVSDNISASGNITASGKLSAINIPELILARYIEFEIPGTSTRSPTVREIEVYDKNDTKVDLTVTNIVGPPTNKRYWDQNSSDGTATHQYHWSNIVDGDKSQNPGVGTWHAHQNHSETTHVIKMDMGSEKYIKKISIWNRWDGNQRLSLNNSIIRCKRANGNVVREINTGSWNGPDSNEYKKSYNLMTGGLLELVRE